MRGLGSFHCLMVVRRVLVMAGQADAAQTVQETHVLCAGNTCVVCRVALRLVPRSEFCRVPHGQLLL